MSDAFTKPDQPTDGPDVNGFSLKSWIKGTALVTRSVPVCGMPQLMGHIEGLKDELERVQSAEFDDDRPMAKSQALALAEQLEAARAQMMASMVTFTFRGLRAGELEKIKAEHGPDDADGITDLDYKVWAATCVKPAGVTWQDLKALHVGDDEQGIEGLGAYFMQTIARTANLAASGGGVDIPFSSASSSLIATSSKS
jgi:hypothetical protein